MNRWSRWGVALFLVAFVAVSVQAQDAPKKDAAKKEEPKKDTAKKEEPKKLDEPKKPVAPAGPKTMALPLAEVIHVEPGKQSFRIRIKETYTQINQGEVNAALQQQQAAAAAAQRGDRQGYINAINAMNQHKSRIQEVKVRDRDITLEAHEKCEVRLPGPKESFDEMGNVKKYTAKELDALRGKDKLFDAEFSDLTVGQVVQVNVVVRKPAPKPLNKDDLVLDDNKDEATRIVIVRQPKIK